jgi:hypothetical protein
MASLGAHGAHTPLDVSSGSGVGRRGHRAEEETVGRLLLVASKSYLPQLLETTKKCGSNSSTVEDANEEMHVPFCLASLKSALKLYPSEPGPAHEPYSTGVGKDLESRENFFVRA